MINRIRKWFWTLVAKWKYRKQGYDEVCCCGNAFVTKYILAIFRFQITKL